MRIVFSFASISRSFFSTPGNSTTATKSSARWKMLIGGKLPTPAVLLPIQSLARRESSARWIAKSDSNGSSKVIMVYPCAPTFSAPSLTEIFQLDLLLFINSNIVDLLSVCVDALDREGQRLAILRQHFGYRLDHLPSLCPGDLVCGVADNLVGSGVVAGRTRYGVGLPIIEVGAMNHFRLNTLCVNTFDCGR